MVDASTRQLSRKEWLDEVRAQLSALDHAVFRAIEVTPTPVLDGFLVRVSNAANNSRIWLVTAGAVAAGGGERGRRVAADAVLAIGMASVVSNLVLKPLYRRRRPPAAAEEPSTRQVRHPTSASFPSGHAASAFAFASVMGEGIPPTWMPLHLSAGLVAYSRVHTGVHYPSDVVAGALVGAFCGWTVRRLAGRWASPAMWTWGHRVGRR